MVDDALDSDIRNMLEDSLSYSPLKDVTNKENAPALFFSSIERARKSPSTARLFALLGGGTAKNDTPVRTPDDTMPTPKRLNDFWGSPDNSGLLTDRNKPLSELQTEIMSLRASLALIQKDCEFHRQRAVDANDQVDRLQTYISTLEEENRQSKPRVSEAPKDDTEKVQLRLSIDSMETLNRSLARQNDILRSRTSVLGRLSQKDARVQTDEKLSFSVATETCFESALPFMATPSQADWSPLRPIGRTDASPVTRNSETQTQSGVWVTVEGIPETDVKLPRATVRIPGVRDRRSLPSYSSYPMSPVSVPPPAASVPKPLLAASGATRRPMRLRGEPSPVMSATRTYLSHVSPVAAAPASYVFLSRTDWRPVGFVRRGKSLGSVKPRPRWKP